MQEIFLKIKKSIGQANRQTASSANSNQIKQEKAAAKIKFRRNLFFWILLALVLVEAGAIAYILILKPASRYQPLIPADAVSTIYFNYSGLNDLANSLVNKQSAWPPFVSLAQNLADFFNRADIKASDIKPLFEDQMAFVFLPSLNDSAKWILMATQKISDNQFKLQMDQIEKKLKQNFNLTQEIYRQITITEVKPLNQNYRSFYLAYLKNLFIFSNDTSVAKNIIDKILR